MKVIPLRWAEVKPASHWGANSYGPAIHLPEFILRTVEIEVWLRRAGDVNPLIVSLTKNQGTDVPRSPQFSPRQA